MKLLFLQTLASILAILEGLIPTLVEPKLETYTINPDLIEDRITSKTKFLSFICTDN
jgi:dTDP-4-amino-4,6-dideoxygalactose transaminase